MSHGLFSPDLRMYRKRTSFQEICDIANKLKALNISKSQWKSSADIGMDYTTARYYINVASDLRIQEHHNVMPDGIKTLVYIHRLSDRVFNLALKKDVIHPKCSHLDIQEFAKKHPEPTPINVRCRKCNGDTKKLGKNRYLQQKYQCKLCKAITCTGEKHNIRRVKKPKIACCRCMSTNTYHVRTGIIRGKIRQAPSCFCYDCKRYFSVGGKVDLDRYHLLLLQRITVLNLPTDVADILFNLTSYKVLTGWGDCWNIALDTKAAWNEARGDPYQAGSDHPVYKIVNGLPFDD